MPSTLSRITLCAVAVPSFLIGAASPALGQFQQGGFVKQGGFAAVTFMPGFTFDGVTFDGETAYKEVDGEELFFLPQIDEQPLIRGVLGYRGKNASLEVSYERTQHDGAFVGIPMGATFQAVNLDARYFFATSGRVQPYMLAGGSLPWFRVKNGSFNDPDVGDARFRGWGVNTEAGVTIYPVRQFGVGIGYAYRVFWFDRASGATDRLGDLRPRFRESSGNVVVTGTVIF